MICVAPYASVLPPRVARMLTMIYAALAPEQASVVLILAGHSAFRSFAIPRDRVILELIGFRR